jgi:hypothetical protein
MPVSMADRHAKLTVLNPPPPESSTNGTKGFLFHFYLNLQEKVQIEKMKIEKVAKVLRVKNQNVLLLKSWKSNLLLKTIILLNLLPMMKKQLRGIKYSERLSIQREVSSIQILFLSDSMRLCSISLGGL